MSRKDPGEPELFNRFALEFKALEGKPFILETTALHAWVIMCHIQLALRHPLATGPTSQVARQVAERIIATLAPQGSALREIAERLWDQKYDRVRNEDGTTE